MTEARRGRRYRPDAFGKHDSNRLISANRAFQRDSQRDPVLREFITTSAWGIATSLYLYTAAKWGYTEEALVFLVIAGFPLTFLIRRLRNENKDI